MVGLIVEQHFLPIFRNVLEESDKYLAVKSELAFASERSLLSTGKLNKVLDSPSLSSSKSKWFGARGSKTPWKSDEYAFDEVQELLHNAKILNMTWRSDSAFTIALTDGKMINFAVKNLFTGEYLCGIEKCCPFQETVSDMAYNDRLMMYLMSDGRLHVIWKEHSLPLESDFTDSDCSSTTYSNFLPNKTSKRSEKRLTLAKKSNTFAIWWSTSKDDVLPWLPNPEQRANLFIYSLEAIRKDPVLMWFLKTDNLLLQVHLLLADPNRVIILDKSSDSEGSILVTETIYSISATQSRKESEAIIPLQNELTAFAYDQSISKLALTCCDASVLIYCQESKTPRSAKAIFIPFSVSWHPESNLIFLSGESGQYQFFDIALTPVLIFENNMHTISLKHELAICSAVQKSCWMYLDSDPQSGDSLLLLRFESGPLIVLRLAIQGLKLLDLINFYLVESCILESINVLKNVPWTNESLQGAYAIFSHLIKQKPCDEIECHLEQLLAVYFVPTFPVDDGIAMKLDLRPMRVLARRFFMWLLHGRKFHRALQIATSLNDPGLFYKLHQVARLNGDTTTAFEAMQKLKENNPESLSESDSDSTSSHSDSGSWRSSNSESYPSCQSSEVEQDSKFSSGHEKVNSSNRASDNISRGGGRRNLNPNKTSTDESNQTSQPQNSGHGSTTSSNTNPLFSDPKISVINFGPI